MLITVTKTRCWQAKSHVAKTEMAKRTYTKFYKTNDK